MASKRRDIQPRRSFEVLRVKGWRQYGGDPLDLRELNRIALNQLEAEQTRPNSRGNRIEGRVRIHEHASVHASVMSVQQ
jgi:hypothetical protein